MWRFLRGKFNRAKFFFATATVIYEGQTYTFSIFTLSILLVGASYKSSHFPHNDLFVVMISFGAVRFSANKSILSLLDSMKTGNEVDTDLNKRVEDMLSGSDSTSVGMFGKTPLHKAAYR